MALSVGIVGLPNVGKSTLFNALAAKQAEAANYAFCTIEPNVGVVPVPDPRFDALVALNAPEKITPATVEFVDIAGLVRGASKGEGKGNAFLSHIRQADAIAHVVRCFDDPNITHVEGKVDPLADIDTIHTELLLKDLETVEKRHERAKKYAKANDPVEKLALSVCERLEAALSKGEWAAQLNFDEKERPIVLELSLLSMKPRFYIANIKEDRVSTPESEPHYQRLKVLADKEGVPLVPISAALEAEIMQLPVAERSDFIASAGLKEPSLHEVIRTGYRLLQLLTFFTAGKKEVRAWTIRAGTKAPEAAGKIHSDFERGFIRAEVIWWEDLIALKTEAACRAAGKMASEGKEYVMRDGDVVHFRFNV